MAASLTIGKLVPMLSALRLPQVQQVRNHRVALRPRRKKPIQKWFDPADQSWAEPILKYQKEKESRPPPEPALLHMVYRIKDHYTRPYWEKDVLKEFGLFEKSYTPVVLKNTPEINEKLKTVKHLLRIKPVTFPYGLPVDEEDYKHCYLRHNGEFVVRHRINDQSDEIEKAWAEVKFAEDNPSENIWKMDKETIQNETRNVLQRFRLSSEYFKVKHVYKYNQDGKEFRYKGAHDIASTRQDWY
ncbi:hypothetical protein BsWGS_27441 [Bradybaena similaris]